jgi:hypothetical protein
MTIDNNPTIDSNNYTFTVENEIDTSEDVSIFINGALGITLDDITDITDNIITVDGSLNIDYTNDLFYIMYTSL